jgi:sulfate transport system ATP-binding protein
VVLMNHGRVEQQGTPEEVYEKPASPFVYGFLGNVNLFHGRAQDGWLHVGDTALEAPEARSAQETRAIAYARPHEIEVERWVPGEPGLRAKLKRSLSVGAYARLELEREDDGSVVEVEIPRESHRRLGLREGEALVVRPRRLQVFLEGEHAI